MAKVHIVIPLYNRWDLCHELMWQLYRKERENIASITLVNDCSTDPEVEGGIKWWCSKSGTEYPVHIVTNSVNRGFLMSSFEGILFAGAKQPKDDIIVLLSTDVKVYGKFLSQIIGIISGNPKSLIGGVVYTGDTGWNKFGEKIYPYAEGWLLASTVGGWKELGYFDTRYAPAIFEDVDLSTQALSLGYDLVPLNNPGLQHLSGQTIKYSPERDELTRVNQEKFRNKWVTTN